MVVDNRTHDVTRLVVDLDRLVEQLPIAEVAAWLVEGAFLGLVHALDRLVLMADDGVADADREDRDAAGAHDIEYTFGVFLDGLTFEHASPPPKGQ